MKIGERLVNVNVNVNVNDENEVATLIVPNTDDS